MKTFASLATAAFALVAGVPVANAQALVTQPHQTLIVQPGTTVIISTVETVRTIHPVARSHASHHVVASRKIQDRVALNYGQPPNNMYGQPLYNMAPEPVIETPVAEP